MSTALAPVQERFTSTVDLFMQPDRYAAFKSMATVMFAGGRGCGLIPDCFQDGQQVQAAMMVAMSMGRDPIQALQYAMPMPKNKLGWDYKWLMSVAEERAPQYRWGVIEMVPGKKFRGWMQATPDHPRYESEYTIEMARQAGLVKDKSAWETQTDDMIFKSWWLRSGRRVIPSAMMGLTVYDVDRGDEAVIPEVAATGDAVTADSPAPPAAPAPAESEVDWKNEFLALAKKHGWNPKDGAKMKELLETLLVVEGVVTKYKSAAAVPMSDWRLGVQKLRAKYEKGASDAQVVESETGTPASATTGAATDAEPVSESPVADEEPVVAEEPAVEPTSMSDADAEAAQESQQSDPVYLMSLCDELEKAWKAKGTVVKPSPKDKAKMWFTNTEMLREIGSLTDDGGVQPLAFFTTNDPRKMLDKQRTYALVHQVLKALDTHRNGGRPAPAQQAS